MDRSTHLTASPEALTVKCFLHSLQYLTPKAGLFKEFLTGLVLDEHRGRESSFYLSHTFSSDRAARYSTGVHHYTLGQRANIMRADGPFYIAQMDFHTQDIYVVRDPYHPCLFMRKCWTAPAVWINSSPPNLPSSDVQFQWQNKWRSVTCKIEPYDNLVDAAMSVHPCADKKLSVPVGDHLLQTMDTDCEADRHVGPCLSITLDEPMRCIASGQWAALYAGNRCLGGAMICGSVSLWDEGRETPYTEWDYARYELDYHTVNIRSAVN
ncbi:tRNA-5-taurinomethyluridine 2-sulfurtransferase [Paragonimus westermani]|uniref:tRNA-5-taurinomethyluridine 2-sulfurtransferase n=1 Tax=Paragonimus westermani TaxID=34504 RepID=A0A5J4NK49_9TREM|nr:tRNA-5-taurinomethyluridine 2-sulfurtransferase [Paragonimus westermani]